MYLVLNVNVRNLYKIRIEWKKKKKEKGRKNCSGKLFRFFYYTFKKANICFFVEINYIKGSCKNKLFWVFVLRGFAAFRVKSDRTC